MKTKSKKAGKTKISPEKPEKKAEERVALATTTPPVVTINTTKNIREVASDLAPIEVLHEERRAIVTKISSEERRRLISMAAYYRAQRVGFGKTNPIEDWLLAEREVDAMIGREDSP